MFCTEPTNDLASSDLKQHLGNLTGVGQAQFGEALEDVALGPKAPRELKKMWWLVLGLGVR